MGFGWVSQPDLGILDCFQTPTRGLCAGACYKAALHKGCLAGASPFSPDVKSRLAGFMLKPVGIGKAGGFRGLSAVIWAVRAVIPMTEAAGWLRVLQSSNLLYSSNWPCPSASFISPASAMGCYQYAFHKQFEQYCPLAKRTFGHMFMNDRSTDLGQPMAPCHGKSRGHTRSCVTLI